MDMKKFLVILLVLISVVFAACAYVKLSFPLKYAENVKTYAARYNLDESLVFAVIKAESGFDKDKVSPKGAVGLMQIMPKTAEYVSKEFFSGRKFDLTNPGDNIELGCFYLAYLAEKFDNRAEILAAYNAGEGNVKLWKKEKGAYRRGHLFPRNEKIRPESYAVLKGLLVCPQAIISCRKRR